MMFSFPYPPGLCLNVTSFEEAFLALLSDTFELYIHTSLHLASHIFPVLPSTLLIIISNYILICCYSFIIHLLTSWKLREGQGCLSLHSPRAGPERKIKCKLFVREEHRRAREGHKGGKAAKRVCYLPAAVVGTWGPIPQGKSGKRCKTYAWGMGGRVLIHQLLPVLSVEGCPWDILIPWHFCLARQQAQRPPGIRALDPGSRELGCSEAASPKGIHQCPDRVTLLWETILFPDPHTEPGTW